MAFKRIFTKFKHLNNILKGRCHYSYSQAGEDVIVNYLFRSLGIDKPSYFEIGSNHPFIDNNTYLFYCKGSTGVCMEPDPVLYNHLKSQRPRDVVINAGIGLTSSEADFYSFPQPYTGWNTFSKEEAMEREKQGNVKVKEVRKVQLLDVNEVLQGKFAKTPEFLSIDVEGLDLPILRAMNFEKHRPPVICAETISFSISNKEEKNNELIDFVRSKGYFVYADTHINTIFCRTDIFNREK